MPKVSRWLERHACVFPGMGKTTTPLMPKKLSMPVYCLALMAFLAACEALGPADALPPSAQLIAAPDQYREWWTKTESCSGRSGNFARITWYVIPDVQSCETSSGPKVGLWTHSSDGVRIVLAGAYTENELVVRHEMLHALLDREGHPAEYFQTRCALTWDSWGSQ
jgi:hypothetical protein